MAKKTNMNNNGESIGIILLAAGSSSRLGRPKQLLHYHGKTLLQHSLQAAIDSNTKPVIVVLGANAGLIEKELEGQPVQLIINPEWQEGMASSIRCGITELIRVNPAATGVIMMVCDQPSVSAGLLTQLISTHQNTGKPIVTCKYADTLGTPSFFHQNIFPELLQLKGDVGAKSILRHHAHELELISFPGGQFDIDTLSDYENILQPE